MKIEAKIDKIMPDTNKPLKAFASIVLDGKYAVHNIRIVQGDSGYFLGMPYRMYTDKDGKETRRDIFHPLTPESRKDIEDAVISEYKKETEKNNETEEN